MGQQEEETGTHKNNIWTKGLVFRRWVKRNSVNVIWISPFLSPSVSCSFFSLSLCLFLEIGPMGQSEREREKGVKNGDARLVFLLGLNRAGLLAWVCTSCFYLPAILSSSWDQGGLNWICWGGVGRASKCCEAVGLSNWWCPPGLEL